MIQIFNIHIDNNFKVTDGTVDNVQVGNVGIVTRHQVGNFAQTARFVAQNQFQAAGMSLVFGALAPRNVGSLAKRSSDLQLTVCTATPLPVVTIPTIRSPGSG